VTTKLQVFISYRRNDASSSAGRIFDWLSHQFGKQNVFLDTEKIAKGDNFVQTLQDRLKNTDILIAVIGREWLTAANEKGRRLDQADDFVRMEIATALRCRTRIIPVLVDGASMPASDELPVPLQSLAQLNAALLTDARFEQDFDLLVDDILERPHGYIKSELDRLYRLLKAIRVSSLVIPTVVMIALLSLWIGVLDIFTLDTRVSSYLIKLGNGLRSPPSDPGVLLVAIDKTCEEELGQEFNAADLPAACRTARRANHALLIDRAVAAGAKAVVFDIFLEQQTSADNNLASAIRRARDSPSKMRVVFGVRKFSEQGMPKLAPAFLGLAEWGSLCIGKRLGYTFSVPLVVLNNEKIDNESVSAKTPALALAAVHGASSYEVNSARKTVRINNPESPRSHQFSYIERIRNEQNECKTLAKSDDVARMLINVSPDNYWDSSKRRVSYENVLDAETVTDEQLRDRIILVGSTISGIDQKKLKKGIGFSSRLIFGVEIHADAIANLIQGRVITTPTIGQALLVLILSAVTAAIFGYMAAPLILLWRILIVIALVAVYMLVAAFCANHNLLLNMPYDITAFFIAYTFLHRLRMSTSKVRTDSEGGG